MAATSINIIYLSDHYVSLISSAVQFSTRTGRGCWHGSGLTCLGCKPPGEASKEVIIPKVTVAPVTSQQTQDADIYTGRTEASEIVEVRRVFGYLESIEFKDGDYVKEGQKLFVIEDDEYAAIHAQAKSKIELNTARLELAKANLARNTKLVKSGAVSQEDFEETAAAAKEKAAMIKAAEADANRTAVDLKYTVVKRQSAAASTARWSPRETC